MKKKKHKELQIKYGVLREKCAELVECANHLEEVEGPELSSRYMMEIGQYEMRVFELTIEIRRWKRRFELRQEALNIGCEPDLIAIEAKLDDEFCKYMNQLKMLGEKMEAATARFHQPALTDKQSTEVRWLYLNAAKRLHPDVNANVNDRMSNLWARIQAAYKNFNWREVRFLCGLIDVVAAVPREFPDTPEGIEELTHEIERLEGVAEEQRKKIADMKAHEPWSFAERLSDVEAVQAEQRDLKEEIDAMLKRIKEYETQWQEVLT